MEVLNQPIQVVARFRDGKFEPTRFLWDGRPQRVKSVTGRWASREGRDRIYHFAVVNENGTYFEVSLHTRHMDWTLNKSKFPDRAVKLCRPYINLMFGEKTRLVRAVCVGVK